MKHGILCVAFAAFLAIFVPTGLHAQVPTEAIVATEAPTTVIVNARVWTGVPGAADAEAVAITANKISATGPSAEIKALADARTVVIDAGGRRVIPGITDSHTHIIGMGLQLARLDLRTAPDKTAFINAVAAAAAKLSPGSWLLGGRYTVESWAHPESPKRAWIDPLTPGNPVFLVRMDGHQALVNTVALKYAGITLEGPPDPPGGEIKRDPETGEPTGILKDDAMALVRQHIPPPDEREQYAALLRACRVVNAWGITSIHDMSEESQLPIFRLARKRGALTVRVCSYVAAPDFEKAWPTLQALKPEEDDFFRVAGYKAFMDGSLGSRTAYMREPYTDATPTTKYPRGMRSGQASDLRAFAKKIRWAHDHHQQMAVHAIGDQAIHELLDIYAGLPDVTTRRHRVEHAQHLLPEDITRFAKLGVIASMQPLHKADDGRYAEAAIGPVRARTSYAFKSLLDAHATLCFGSDCPVVTANPFAGIAAAVSAKTRRGDVWIPEQSITRRQALTAYTVTPPYAIFAEQSRGTLEVGKLADLAILDTDILTAPIDRLADTEAVLTMVGGRVVWRAAGGKR